MNSSEILNRSEFSDKFQFYGRFWNTMPVIGIATVICNIIAITIISRSKTIVQNLKVYISSLMACDCFTGFNLVVVPIVHWLVNAPRLVDVSAAVIRTLLQISILHSAGLAVDRLVSVKYPIFYALHVNKRTCVFFCACIWFILSVNQVIVSMISSNDPMGGQFDKTVYTVFLTIYFSCLLIFLVSSKTIIQCARCHLNRQTLRLQQHPEREQQVTTTFRFSIVITTASGCLFALYLPVQVFIILTFIDPAKEMKVTRFFSDISYPLLMLESLLNPLLYIVKFRESRNLIKQFFCPSGNARENQSTVFTLRTFNVT